MSKKKGRRNPVRIISVFLWVLLSMAAGAVAVETLMSQDGNFYIASQNTDNNATDSDELVTRTTSQAAAPVTDKEMLELRARMQVERIARLTDSLAEVIQGNEQLVRQQLETSKRLAKIEDAFDSITASLTPAGRVSQTSPLPDGGIPLPTIKPQVLTNAETGSQPSVAQIHFPFPTGSKDIALNDPVHDQIDVVAIQNPLVTSSPINVLQTKFAVSVARYTDIEILVQAWLDLRESHFDKLENLEPRVRFENSVGSGLELALIAGPLQNASDAALLCVELGLSDGGCKPVVFSGEIIPSLTRISAATN